MFSTLLLLHVSSTTHASRRRGTLSKLDALLGDVGFVEQSGYRFDGNGVLRAAADLSRDATILRVPASALCSVSNACSRSKGARLFHAALMTRAPQTECAHATKRNADLAVIALGLLQHLGRSGTAAESTLSHVWTAYVEALPPSVSDLPMLWSRTRLETLGGSALRARIALQRARHRRQWILLRRVLGFPRFADGVEGTALIARFDAEDWLRTVAVVQSRWFTFDNDDAALVPILDMANHAPRASLKWTRDRSGAVVVRAARRLERGAALSDSYGAAADFILALPHLLAVWEDEEEEGGGEEEEGEEEVEEDEEGDFSFWSVGWLSHLSLSSLSTLLYGFALPNSSVVVRVAVRHPSKKELPRRVTLVGRFDDDHENDDGDHREKDTYTALLFGVSRSYWEMREELGESAALAALAAACAARARRYEDAQTSGAAMHAAARLEMRLLAAVDQAAQAPASWAARALRRSGRRAAGGGTILATIAGAPASVVVVGESGEVATRPLRVTAAID